MSLQDLAKRLESAAETARIGGQTLLGLDTNPVPAWTHITKVDPESEKTLPLAFPLFLSHTSAVSVGGSRDVTDHNTEETFELVTSTAVPAFHEPSAATHVTEQTREYAEFLAVPEVLNGDSEALVGTLGKGLAYVREDLGPRMIEEKTGLSLDSDGLFGKRIADFAAAYLMQEAVFEAYIIMNTDSAAAREANVSETDLLSVEEAKERALAAQYHLESEIIYLEYSGTFGGEEAVDILDAIDDNVAWSRVWYGGGLDNREDAKRVLDAGADAVVVGDVFHDIATEEADLFEAARERFDGVPNSDRLRAFVESEMDVPNTSATRYLSTIPEVSNPEQRAVEYLAAGVELALGVEALAGEQDDSPTGTGLRRALREEGIPAQSQFETTDEGTDIAERLALTLLGERFEIGTGDDFAARHLEIEL